MQPSKEQIEAAARLAPDVTYQSFHGLAIRYAVTYTGYPRKWQPWADTEAGQSDAFVLLAAVCKWAEDHDGFTSGNYVTVEQANAMHAVYHALYSGNVQKIQAATFAAAAAIAIGQHMEQSNEN